MNKIIIITGSELRHIFFRKALALTEGIEVLRSYCEGTEMSLRNRVESSESASDIMRRHVEAREHSEEDFFGHFARMAPDRSNPFHLPKGEINLPRHGEEMEALSPDLIIAYGCSIIKDIILSRFNGRVLNLHLGLSPYYRGSGTNFFPFVNREPEYAGATFMYMDAGIDTGAIIHQVRPRIYPDDNFHQIGNRLIGDATLVYSEIILGFDRLQPMPQPPLPAQVHLCRRKDFDDSAVRKLYANLESGLIKRYLQEREARCSAVPIITNPALGERPA